MEPEKLVQACALTRSRVQDEGNLTAGATVLRPSSIPESDVIDKRRAQHQILFRRQTAEFSKFVDEVRLVEVTKRESDIRPIHRDLGSDTFDHLSESREAMKAFRRQA